MSTDTQHSTQQVPVVPMPPRTRWAAIVWGTCFAALSATGLWLLTRPDAGNGIAVWVSAQTPGTITATVLLCIGALVLVGGAIGVVRHAQRRFSAPRP